ncbi:MAG: hypothetical protein HY817_03315 [Candidatus Abawacabacteria bacterium]|nr:hypothetical protein [Candidatus Abawacabacteria bacterium]
MRTSLHVVPPPLPLEEEVTAILEKLARERKRLEVKTPSHNHTLILGTGMVPGVLYRAEPIGTSDPLITVRTDANLRAQQVSIDTEAEELHQAPQAIPALNFLLKEVVEALLIVATNSARQQVDEIVHHRLTRLVKLRAAFSNLQAVIKERRTTTSVVMDDWRMSRWEILVQGLQKIAMTTTKGKANYFLFVPKEITASGEKSQLFQVSILADALRITITFGEITHSRAKGASVSYIIGNSDWVRPVPLPPLFATLIQAILRVYGQAH